MSEAIIYYSRTGKTRYVARQIAKKVGADEFEINDLTIRSGLSAYISFAFDKIVQNRTKIEPESVDLTGYDKIYIGSPVWGADIAPAIYEIMDNTDFKGKDVVVFTTFKKSGAERSLSILTNLIQLKGANVIKAFSISSEDLDEFMENTKIAVSKL